ncbi:MAG: glycosyltransferase family 2 protein [Eubacteriales bacterium]|nr:glycosyltransferase family 2 protein [Eubacteriales bacterium]
MPDQSVKKREGVMAVILPSYNEELNIEKAVVGISQILEKESISYEMIFVDDGSTDGTWREILTCADAYSHVKGVHFSRNFGKEAAIMAGLAQSVNACSVVMDCDLQHPPETLVEMYRKWQDGYDVVEGVKRSRGKENVFYHTSAMLFYKLISKAVKIDMSRASDFKLMDRAVVKSLLQLPEKNAFFRALSSWVGYRTTQIEFDVQEREFGESKWSIWALMRYAITNVASFSTAPMQIVTILGVMVFAVAVIMSIQTMFNYVTGRAVAGFTTVILLLLLMGSIIMISLGIIGYYIAKIYEEVKGRPRYIISELTVSKEDEE